MLFLIILVALVTIIWPIILWKNKKPCAIAITTMATVWIAVATGMNYMLLREQQEFTKQIRRVNIRAQKLNIDRTVGELNDMADQFLKNIRESRPIVDMEYKNFKSQIRNLRIQVNQDADSQLMNMARQVSDNFDKDINEIIKALKGLPGQQPIDQATGVGLMKNFTELKGKLADIKREISKSLDKLTISAEQGQERP